MPEQRLTPLIARFVEVVAARHAFIGLFFVV
jgi:hypothetical protein